MFFRNSLSPNTPNTHPSFEHRHALCYLIFELFQAHLKRNWAFLEGATLIAVVFALAATFLSPKANAQQTATAGLHILPGHVPPAVSRYHLHPLHDFPETNQLDIDISLPLRNQPALNDLLKQIYDPKSPNYHDYLTPDEFT